MTDTETYSDYTESASAAESADKNGETDTAANDDDDQPQEQQQEDDQPQEQANATNEEEEEQKQPEPEPEPEPDPLEGLTYDDDPEVELPPYGDQAYWEKRYTEDTEVFEWYQDPEAVLPVCNELIDKDKKVLVIGNGNSNLAPQLVQNGFEQVTAIDFAKPCIKSSKKRNAELEGITWKVMDIRKMTSFENGEYNAIVDKGTLDCLFYASESDVFTALSEISRVLRKRGVYICISYAPPEARKKFLDRPADLLLELERVLELKKPLPSSEPHYVYVLRKIGKLLT